METLFLLVLLACHPEKDVAACQIIPVQMYVQEDMCREGLRYHIPRFEQSVADDHPEFKATNAHCLEVETGRTIGSWVQGDPA